MKVNCHLSALSSVPQCYTGSLDASFILLLTVMHIVCKKSAFYTPMNSAACAEEIIPRSEDKDLFAAQSIRLSDSKADAVNNHLFPSQTLCEVSHFIQ